MVNLKKIKYRRRARKNLKLVGEDDRELANDIGDVAALMERDLRRMVWRDRFSKRNLAGLAFVLLLPATLAGYVLAAGMPR